MKVRKLNKSLEECKELMRLFLHENEKPNFPKEVTIGKRLLKFYPIEFWRQYDPQRKFHSLSIFLTEECKKHLSKEYQMFLMLKPKENIVLSDKPVVGLEEYRVKPTKSKSLLEFVDNVL